MLKICEKNGLDALIIAILIAISVIQCFYLFDIEFDKLVLRKHLVEDSFISLRVAQNIAAGYGESFDTINRTNGFQPLWVWLLAPFFIIIGNPFSTAQIAWILCAVLFHLAIYIILKEMNGILRNPWMLAICGALPALSPALKLTVVKGLETPLFLFLIAATFSIISRTLDIENSRLSVKKGVCVGVLLALSFFARLDSFLASFVLLIVVIFLKRPIGERLKFLFATGITEFFLVAPYLARNVILFGRIMPLSGAVKRWYLYETITSFKSYIASSEWMGPVDFLQRYFFSGILFDSSTTFAFLTIIFIVCLLVAFIAVYRKGSIKSKLWITYALFHILFFVFIYRENRPSTNYYFVVETLVFGFIIMFFIAKWLKNSKLMPIVLVAMIILFSAQTIRLSPKDDDGYLASRNKAAIWARENLPKNAIVGSFWAGTFSFVSQLAVVNLDGICNDGVFFDEYLRKGKVDEYIIERDIEFIADYFPGLDLECGIILTRSENWADIIKIEALEPIIEKLEIVAAFEEDFYILSVNR